MKRSAKGKKKVQNKKQTQVISRVVISKVSPEIDGGAYPIKRTVGEYVSVKADIYADGHDHIVANLKYRPKSEEKWTTIRMKDCGNDSWQAAFKIEKEETYFYTVEGWADYFLTWHADIQKKHDAGQDIILDLKVGENFVADAMRYAEGDDKKELSFYFDELQYEKDTNKLMILIRSQSFFKMIEKYPGRKACAQYSRELSVQVDRKKARFSTWYEIFPRSCTDDVKKHGSFKSCLKYIPRIAKMGFDVLYFPPIHPIGKTNRKGKDNALLAEKTDPGSPWAIGSQDGGHKKIEKKLGTMADFKKVIAVAREHDMEVALDIAFQCSPDHPYVKEHPEWFIIRPDGSIQFAENPPKKYEDIVPFNFESRAYESLWEELKSVFLFWIEAGVRIFRVDNPHTKPFAFWQWVIKEIKADYPEVIFLAEAFTRPKVMAQLAKIGFDQSYTYFTWRNTKHELVEYLVQLTESELSDYFRPNFWPNTPDILPEFLQYSQRPGFIIRFILAATLSSNYGMYGPAYQLCINEAVSGKEEYASSEKYEIKAWPWDPPGSLNAIIERVNAIRHKNKALQQTREITFCRIDNDSIIAYLKKSAEDSNAILVVVNLDPFHTQSGWVQVPLKELGIESGRPFMAYDLLSEESYLWSGEWNYVELNPHMMPAHILRIHTTMKRENDFDYFM